nr:dynein heavy chain 3, axonemal [Ciona intestinalis]|eukprot:XP_026696681.1 dynein heavy chain 3, axonemal [Ciona intestinalis]
MDRANKMQSPIQSSSQTKGLPGLPPLPASKQKHDSDLYQIVLKNSAHPPIMQGWSWTLLSPFKEQRHHRSPSESIANNYTPTAANIKIRDIPVKYRNVRRVLKTPLTRSIGPSPPKSSRKATYPVSPTSPRKKKRLDKVSPQHAKLGNGADMQMEVSSPRRSTKKSSPAEEMEEDLPPSRPMSPMEQITTIQSIEQESASKTKEPTETDLERYYYYIQKGIDSKQLAGPPPGQMDRIESSLPENLRENVDLKILQQNLTDEVLNDYDFSYRKSIIDYILNDENERARVHVNAIPQPFKHKVIRAPVPWKNSCFNAREFCKRSLFTVNPLMQKLQDLWFDKFSSLRFVNTEELLNSDLPLHPSDFEDLVGKQCEQTRDVLIKQWIPSAVKLFHLHKDVWIHLVPLNDNDSTVQVQEFFACAASLMSNQLREMVINSLSDLMNFFKMHQDGNDFGSTYTDLRYCVRPVMLLQLQVRDTKLFFSPSFSDCRDVMLNCFSHITTAAEAIPRVECDLFPEMRDTSLTLRTVNPEEQLVKEFIDIAMQIFKANTIGPQKYLDVYKKYADLLNNKAEMEVVQFIKEEHDLEDYMSIISKFESIRSEILVLRMSVPLSLFCLSCSDLNEEHAARAQKLKDRLVLHQIEFNREQNKSICHRYDAIADRVSEMPESTVDLVALVEFLKTSNDVTIHELKEEIHNAADRLEFLLDYATLPYEDIKLNSNVFHWPDQIHTVFDINRSRLLNRRESAEDKLRKRIKDFEETLIGYNKEVESFKRKEVATPDEMQRNVDKLNEMTKLLEQATQDLETINEEERLLEFEESSFPILQSMFQFKQPYDNLWNTALQWHTKNELWMNGSFQELNSEEINEDIGQMWRTAYKLTKSFSDAAGPRRIAEAVKSKIDKFKQHLPILSTICNPGIKERHWEQISDIVGFDIKPEPETSLLNMLEFGLSKFIDEMEQIGTNAGKEFALEKSLFKMKTEWAEITFTIIPYRDTDQTILGAVDEIQVLLDDNIVKCQTMRGSPYIAPFMEEFSEWEEKLVLMQDILDAWLKCQATWLYLEPIFSSEDILAQMPEEGRKFGIVDAYWRDIMLEAGKDCKVLVATAQHNMLGRLNESNLLLDEIQKGLNDYLEKKRIFFPRFFFLSNDELLEILSETKDPLRVQPHLKKCFEGIAKLQFTEQMEITGMISSEGEVVPFTTKIYPAKAKGMVEKWLLEVESNMIVSIKQEMFKSFVDYAEKHRKKWVLDWPGQIILCASQTYWTSEVATAIEEGYLDKYLQQLNSQINDIVDLVRGKLDKGARITLGALTVLDVHARDTIVELVKTGIDNVLDFQWLSQLRYYNDGQDFAVQMINTDYMYGYEYLGNSGRLVITPLTDRCYRTLMGALKLNLGGAPEGPAGTGKTETTKDLAKALAKQCVVFNCSDGLDYKAMGKFFKGLASCGAWACFDEFNRIEIEVLSVVAQQILSIQNGIMQKMKRIIFEGTDISLNWTCAVFITMNPGYAGRTELPDNLKVLFRAVAMMVPDYGMIGEISLYSMGFVDARSLAQKIVATYKLCSEQLSSQHHYDYGMRAVKTVLTAAANMSEVKSYAASPTWSSG